MRVTPPKLAEQLRVELAESIAAGWERVAIDYVVVHGLHGYPDRLGRDLDVVLRSRDVDVAARQATELAFAAGFQRVRDRRLAWGVRQLVFVTRDEPYVHLALDLLYADRVWTNAWAYTGSVEWVLSQPVSHIGPFRSSPRATFLKAVVRPLLVGDLARFAHPEKATEWPARLGADEDAVLEQLFCDSAAMSLREALSVGPADAATLGRRARRRHLIHHIGRHPLRSGRAVAARAFVAVGTRIQRPAVIALARSEDLREALGRVPFVRARVIAASGSGLRFRIRKRVGWIYRDRVPSTSEPTLLVYVAEDSPATSVGCSDISTLLIDAVFPIPNGHVQ